jgi:DNA-binding winged helix-turn-helix (wHTH) protein/Tfp pilus assembly protein PilF
MRRAVWTFAGFTFSAARGLECGACAIPMQAKPRGLLELLLRADGSVVRKDTIAAALWSSEPPSDASIARAVSGLRKALGGAGEDILRTIYGEGVQLACHISIEGGYAARDREAVAPLLRTAWEVAASRTPEGYARAFETLRHAVKRFPEAAPAWALMADAYASRAVRSLLAPADAAAQIHRCCEMALRADPACGQALAVSGWALGLLMGRSEEGLRRLDSSINEGSDWPTFLYRAWLHVEQRDLEGASEDLERGLALSPLDRSLLDMRAFVMLYQGKFDEADAYARNAQKVRDDVDGLWIVRSIVACESGDFVRGCAHAERAAALSGRDRQTAMHLAYAYARAGDADRARKTLAGNGPGVNGHTPALLAAAYLALGELAEARRIVKLAQDERCPYGAVVWCDPRLKALWSKN